MSQNSQKMSGSSVSEVPQNSQKISGSMWVMSHRTHRKCSGMFTDFYPYFRYCSDEYTEVTDVSG